MRGLQARRMTLRLRDQQHSLFRIRILQLLQLQLLLLRCASAP